MGLAWPGLWELFPGLGWPAVLVLLRALGCARSGVRVRVRVRKLGEFGTRPIVGLLILTV